MPKWKRQHERQFARNPCLWVLDSPSIALALAPNGALEILAIPSHVESVFGRAPGVQDGQRNLMLQMRQPEHTQLGDSGGERLAPRLCL